MTNPALGRSAIETTLFYLELVPDPCEGPAAVGQELCIPQDCASLAWIFVDLL